MGFLTSLRRLLPVLPLAFGLGAPLQVQADAAADKSYLAGLLEDNLSGDDRVVTIDGFQGALSSRATITRLTVADSQGVWLEISGIVLDWNRAALMSGAVSVNALTAEEIRLERLPQASAAAASPEAGGFALPELPVSVQIGKLSAARITLGAPVLGTAVQGRLSAGLSLAGGEGAANLVLERTDDGPAARIALEAGYANATRQLVVRLQAQEEAGGIAATLLGLPGAPATDLTISGAAPLSDFTATLALRTDGVDRLAGTLRLSESGPADAVAKDMHVEARLAGDMAPLFLPDHAAFFGPAVSLDLTGELWADGRVLIDQFALSAAALALNGDLELAADGLPERFRLNGHIGRSDGAPVLLPLTTDQPVRLAGATLDLGFDAAAGDGWRLVADVTGLDRGDLQIARLGLQGSGRIGRAPGGAAKVSANLRYDAEGLQPRDAALAAALGTLVSGDAALSWDQGTGAVQLPRLTLAGPGHGLRFAGQIAGLDSGLELTGELQAEAEDFSRYSGLAGRPLAGAGQLRLTGAYRALTGFVDAVAEVTGQGLALGQPELDGLLAGTARLGLSVRRDDTGTQIRALTLDSPALRARASGQIASDATRLVADFTVADLAALGPGYGGALSGRAGYEGTLDAGLVTLSGTGQGLRVGQAEADRLLAGTARLDASARVGAGAVQLQALALETAQTRLTARGDPDFRAGQRLIVDGRLANLAVILPQFPGALVLSGTVEQNAAGYGLNLRGQGPGGIDARVTGTLSGDAARADLRLAGRAQAALANAFVAPRAVRGDLAFDLALKGPVALRTLTGRARLSGGRIADPGLAFAFDGVTAEADLAGGRARIDARLPLTSGGAVAVTGTVGMAAPFAGDLALQIDRARLRDPALYETTARGALTVTGPLAGGARIAGRIALTETELRVPSTGFGGPAGLEDLRHLHEPGEVRATRARAGQPGGGSAGGQGAGGPAYGLDLLISAPNQVFVRGRGLDAELGGELRLAGTTAAVVPSGAFDLIRGRLEILGKRLDLSEASLRMAGQMVPDLRIVASNQGADVVTQVVIEGPADNPTVTFSSSPEMPQEEVLAQLLFDQSLQNLSAFQALQLANAVATLAGRGGDGIAARLRKGIGLDNLDVQTGTDGGAQVTAGKYLSKKVYTELTVDQAGKSQINLNLDVSRSVTVRGRVSSDGSSGVGVYLEKDY